MNLYIFTLFIAIFIYQSNSFKEECISNAYPPKKQISVKTYQINLNLEPRQRWKHLILDRKPHLAKLFQTFKSFVLNFGHVARIIIKYIDNDVDRLANTMPYGYGDEMRGISEISGVPLGEIVVFNIFYELFSACTSVVTNSGNGKIYHARNLDFGLFMGWHNHSWEITEALKPLIVNLEFIKDQQIVYKTVSFAGYVGVFTGLKKDAFTITLNERFNVDGGFLGLIEWIGGRRDIHWSSILIRRVLETTSTFEEAKQILQTQPLLASTYFIIGGNQTGQASVITRSRESDVDTWDLGAKHSKWFILETNYDNWKQPLFFDDRRTPAMKCLNQKGLKNMGFEALYNVLSSRPVLNKLTAYTSLLQVNSGTIETYIQDCPDPCSPW